MGSSGLNPLDLGIGMEKGQKIRRVLPAGIAVYPRAVGERRPCRRLSRGNPAALTEGSSTRV
jgi:hypothetical protein